LFSEITHLKKNKLYQKHVISLLFFLDFGRKIKMTGEEKPKRRRIMIISGDESIIDEIKNSRNAALCKSLILESQDDEMDLTNSQVNFSFSKNEEKRQTFAFSLDNHHQISKNRRVAHCSVLSVVHRH